jgi:hypothetical protein
MGFGISHAYSHVSAHAFGWPGAMTWAAIVQAVAAVVIGCLTYKVVRLTARYAKAADDSASAANASVKLAREALDRDEIQAAQAKQYFLIAVGMELDKLGGQLDASLHTVKQIAAEILGGRNTGPNFADVGLRTSVFSTQVGKLRNVADPLLIDLIHFYSDLATLESIFRRVNDLGAEFNRVAAPGPSGREEAIRPHLNSALTVLQEQIEVFGSRLWKLRAKLPSPPAVEE